MGHFVYNNNNNSNLETKYICNSTLEKNQVWHSQETESCAFIKLFGYLLGHWLFWLTFRSQAWSFSPLLWTWGGDLSGGRNPANLLVKCSLAQCLRLYLKGFSIRHCKPQELSYPLKVLLVAEHTSGQRTSAFEKGLKHEGKIASGYVAIANFNHQVAQQNTKFSAVEGKNIPWLFLKKISLVTPEICLEEGSVRPHWDSNPIH